MGICVVVVAAGADGVFSFVFELFSDAITHHVPLVLTSLPQDGDRHLLIHDSACFYVRF